MEIHGRIERKRENGAPVWRYEMTKMCFSFLDSLYHHPPSITSSICLSPLDPVYVSEILFEKYIHNSSILNYTPSLSLSLAHSPSNSLWLSPGHISLLYQLWGDFTHFKAFCLSSLNNVGQSSSQISRPKHKAAQGWLRTEWRASEAHREMSAGRMR